MDKLEDSDSFDNLELSTAPQLNFDELKKKLLSNPTGINKNKELIQTLYHYCKESQKHTRIIKNLFWPIIMSLVQDNDNNKISLIGLKAFNQLLTYEGSLEHIILVGKASRLQTVPSIQKIIKYFQHNQTNDDGTELDEKQKAELQNENIRMLNEFIAKRQNPTQIMIQKMLKANSFQIMQEASKAIRNLSQMEVVIHDLMENDHLTKIILEKFLEADPFTQENILETVSFTCSFDVYRQKFANNEKVIEMMLSQVQSISMKVTYFTIKICRQLAQDKTSIEKLQGNNLRLTEKLIIAFKWLDKKIDNENIVLKANNETESPSSKEPSAKTGDEGGRINTLLNIASDNGNLAPDQKAEIYTLVFREISKCFQFILKYYETHKKLLDEAQNSDRIKNHSIETDIIETIVKLGKQTKDSQTMLNAATCLAHITEVLHCNPEVASPDAIDFMIVMLQDAKNLNQYRQGCRYFANLSFYKDFRDQLVEKDIGRFLLQTIDGQLDEDTIKHSAIALANLSSHKDFMRAQSKQFGGESVQISKAEKCKIKPLIHLLDSAQEHKINLIQSACITLCNMASKPQLHQHFIHEPEISTIKNCLANPIDKNSGNELVRFMIKLVCNLTKNPEILGHLSKKGFLEILFDLLNHEKEKEIFGNVVTAISFLSIQKECQEKIIKNKILPRILEPLTQIHEVDQKMIIIGLTSMLFNGIEIQREFIKHGGLGKLLFFMQQKDKIFQQLSCKCFSLLSENQQNLQEILDQECLNTIVISCLRTKDIDLETLKEITKIFINLILWRKITKDTFETTCCLCDIGLMIDDQDINILAIFCLNALSENDESHEYIRNSGVSFSMETIDKGPKDGVEENTKQVAMESNEAHNSQSIFNRINFLLDYNEQKLEKRQEQLDKQALIVTLITSFYLNLARNEANIKFLLNLKLFKRLNSLMQSNLQNNSIDSTALCYTNTIFSKLLKNPQSLGYCVEEEGYKLFIEILKGQQMNKHLFLETLDSIKLFLSKREYLKKFKAIPDCFKLDPDYQDLNISFLQVLAILSFEKENHAQLKSKEFLQKLDEGKIFQMIFTEFDHLVEQKKRDKSKSNTRGSNGRSASQSRLGRGRADEVEGMGKRARDSSQEKGKSSALDVKDKKKSQLEFGTTRRSRVRENQEKNRSEELALAVSIILANLSCDEDFLYIMLGVKDWKPIDENDLDKTRDSVPNNSILSIKEAPIQEDGKEGDFKDIFKNSPDSPDLKKIANYKVETKKTSYGNYNDDDLKNIHEVERITRLFNLLSHDNIYISEQISILLANVSNSPYFRHIFVTDRCMKSLLKILRDQNNDQVARVSQLASLIVVLNLTSMNDIVVGMENMKFMQTLQDIIKDDKLPYVNKSIALLAISNIQTVSKKTTTQISSQTKDFAFQVLLNWKKIRDEEKECIEVVKNLVYASLILFYNLVLKKIGSTETINQLINVITDHILEFEDHQIINVVLELITLFTRKKETSDYIFQKQQILDYVFDKLKQTHQETLRLSSLALSRLAARLDENNCQLFIRNLKEFKEFNMVVDNINSEHQTMYQEHQVMRQNEIEKEKLRLQNTTQFINKIKEEPKQKQQSTGDNNKNLTQQAELQVSQIISKKMRNTSIDCILRYFLNFLENITCFKKIRDELDCSKMFENMMNLYTDEIIVYSKISLISILFNLNFNLDKPKVLSKEFLKRLYKTYKDELKDDNKTKRQIVTIVVSASALEANHKAIIKSNFYTQFKRNINDFYEQLVDADEEVELFGLVNIILNQNQMHLIYQDLKKIHKIALKNNKIEFKTKVDLFLECSKFLAKLSATDDDTHHGIQGGVANLPETPDDEENKKTSFAKLAVELEKDKSEMMDCCLKALLFSLIKIIGLLDTTNFSMFKYFLMAILDCCQNLKHHLIYLIKIENLIEFLKKVLTQDFEFHMQEFDDQVLNFSLRIIVCEIFFNLKQEKHFFKLDNIVEAINLVIKFAQKVIVMNIEKKMFLVTNTLRLLSQMITQIHSSPGAYERIIKTNSIEFVKDALTLSKDLQPCINIDALFCLTNMMNIKELATHPTLYCAETVNNSMVIYFAYNHQVELDECIITFLYTISKYPQYQEYMKDKSKVLYLLMDRQFEQKYDTTTDTSRQKIFSLFHNMTENEEICKQLNAKQFINLTNKMLQQTHVKKYQADYIHELALKSIINMCKHTTENFEEANLKEFLSNICQMYPKFKNLSKQYALRLVTILTKQWQQQKIQDFLKEIIDIMSQFIESCESVIELKLVIMNLEKVASSKQLMKCLADLQDNCKLLIKNIHHFIAKNIMKKDYHSSIEQLFRFCKKLSKQHKAQEFLVNEAIHEICLRYISENLNFTKVQKDEQSLKQILTTVQNIMKMIKNIFEGNITAEQKKNIYDKVTAREQIIADSDMLLTNYKDSEKKDELAIIIVNIIICYNSISNKLEPERVKSWIMTFSERLIAASKQDFQHQDQARSWYMEKYVMILELLVTKNLEKIDKDMTVQLLEIYYIQETKYFTNTIWYKLIKILAHLQNIQEITQKNHIENIMQFILLAYEKAEENLCFFYFMKIVLLIVKKSDNNALLKTYKQYGHILNAAIQFLKANYQQKNDPLVLEILLYIIDMVNFLTKFHLLHDTLNDNDVVNFLIQMLSLHDNVYVMKSLSSTLLEASKITTFYPDLLSDKSLNIFLQKLLQYHDNDTLSNMFDCLRNIIQQTKIPIKYLLATSILKITEDKAIDWSKVQKENIYCILKVLNYNIRYLDDDEEPADSKSSIPLKSTSDKAPTPELLQELHTKSLKYSIIAITNILIQSNEHDLIFYRKLNLLSILQHHCKFEMDAQLNLRFLYLLNLSLSQPKKQEVSSILVDPNQNQPTEFNNEENFINNDAEQNGIRGEINQNKEIQYQATVSLINFLLENIFKFKSIIQIKDQSFQVDMPKFGQKDNNQHKEPYFFEDDTYELNKITGIRLSLSMSLRILYKLSVQKKKVACQAIIENKMSQDLFQFFIPYVEHGNRCCFKQIKQVIKLIKNCSEFIQLHSAILERESVTSLIKLAEQATNDDFSDVDELIYEKNGQDSAVQQPNMTQRKLIIPILRIFISLCSTPQFHWHLSKYNALDLLNLIREKEDDLISDTAKEVCEKVIDHSQEGMNLFANKKSEKSDSKALIGSYQQYQEYNVSAEIASFTTDQNLQAVKNSVLQLEKLLIQQKIKLDRFANPELQSLLQFLARCISEQEAGVKSAQGSDSMQLQLRRIIIKSLVVVLNFIFTKKFLKDVIAGYSNGDVLGKAKQGQPTCVLEEVSSIKIFKESLFKMIDACKSAFGGTNEPSAESFTTFPDFRDVNEEFMFLFCSYAMSQNISVKHLCEFVLPLGQRVLAHAIYSLKKAQDGSTLTQVLTFSSVNAVLESIIVLLRDQDRNLEILSKFEVAALLSDAIQIVRIFERRVNQDPLVKEQFDSKIKQIFANVELATKLIFFSATKLGEESINLILSMLDYHRFRKTGIFAVYCVALMIQDSQAACVENLIPVFTHDAILKEMQACIKDVELKFKKLQTKGSQQDVLDSKNIAKSAAKPEQLEFEEALNLRKSCLQIMVIIIEFLSNAIIKNGFVVIENVQNSMPNSPYKKVQSHHQVTITKITAAQHQELSQIIYGRLEILDLIYFQILMKIDSPGSYTPSTEEIKLAARAFASMPYQVYEQKNPVVFSEPKYFDLKFSVSGYFHALNKVINLSHSEVSELGIDKTSAEEKAHQKQSAYFALYSLLEFLTNTKFTKDQKVDKKKKAEEQVTLDKISFSHLMSSLVSTGLLQTIVKLPLQVEITNPQEESIIRLSIKTLISIIFKGQTSQTAFAAQHKLTQGIVPPQFESVFRQQGITEQQEMLRLIGQFQQMIQKVQNFEISQIHSESYVMYLHLLSQVTVNCTPEGESVSTFQNRDQFLGANITQYLNVCLQEDLRKKLLNLPESGQRNLVFQFFFINYLISICQVDVLNFHLRTDDETKPLAQKIWVILVKILEASSDKELNKRLDQVVVSKSKKADESTSQDSAMMTITKMVLFNMDKLMLTVKDLMSKSDNKQLVHIDEEAGELLVKLLTSNEQNGDLVNKIYEILLHCVEISEHSVLRQNISVLDMSKSLLQISIKHSSVYQCESAFKFLRSLVMASDKYQNKQDIEYSLNKIMPATLKQQPQSTDQ